MPEEQGVFEKFFGGCAEAGCGCVILLFLALVALALVKYVFGWSLV